MKFAKAALTVLYLSTKSTSAWTAAPLSSRARWALGHLHAVATDSIDTTTQGEAATESFRLLFKAGEKMVSPWHDVDLKNDDGTYNMVGSNATCIELQYNQHQHRSTCINIF